MGLGSSHHTYNGWIGQYVRMRRWLDRLKNLLNNRGHDYTTDLFVDYFLAFFQNCYHLRDYLQNTNVVSKNELDKLFENSVKLKACRDICNGTKHFSISKPSIDADFSIFRAYDYFNEYPNNEQWKVLVYDTTYDIVELARDCANEWTNFLLEQKLIERQGDRIKFIETED